MLGQQKIVCIDDNTEILTLLELIFKDDYDVKTAETGKEAIDIANEFKPDLAIIDMNLNVMKGTEVLEELRKNDNSIRSIILTGYDYESYISNIKSFNPDEVVNKPFDIMKLRDVVKSLLSK